MIAHIQSPEKEIHIMRKYDPEAQAARFARCEEALKEAGGRRVNVRLSPKAAKAVDRAMKKAKCSQTDAINSMLGG